MARTITYSIVGQWQLPETVNFADTGIVEGYFTSLTGGGEWQTGTALGSFNRNATLNINLSITPQPGATITNYSVRGAGRLPVGLVLNSTTGQMTGQVSLWPRESAEPEFRRTPSPNWTTATDLGVLNERDEFNVTLSATPLLGTSISKYIVKDGAVPWGLILNSASGELYGAISGIEPSEEYSEKTPKPVINDQQFEALSNGQVINFSITATAPSGQTISSYVIHKGSLPWGLLLNRTTGAITGTVAIPTTDMPSTNDYPFSVRVTTITGAYSTADFILSVI